MNKLSFLTFGVLFLFLFSCKNSTTETQLSLTSDIDSMSYSIGLQVGKNLKTQGPDTINVKAFVKAVEDFYADAPKISIEDANKIVENFFKKDFQKQYGEKKGLNEKFLDDNKSKAGVVSLPSGLQYKIIKEGNGQKPTLESTVKTHYTGTLIDGTKFDSSVDRNEPAVFPVQGVIPGWTEALQLMPVGSKWELYIPYNLAYGERGYPPSIEPFSTLIFELELLSIEKEPAK